MNPDIPFVADMFVDMYFKKTKKQQFFQSSKYKYPLEDQ